MSIHNIISSRNTIANAIMNGEIVYNTIEHYPAVYAIAYKLFYGKRITKTDVRAYKLMQFEDIRKLGYVPKELISALRDILSPEFYS